MHEQFMARTQNGFGALKVAFMNDEFIVKYSKLIYLRKYFHNLTKQQKVKAEFVELLQMIYLHS